MAQRSTDQSRRSQRSGSSRRISLRSEQPLKPRRAGRLAWLTVTLVLLGTTAIFLMKQEAVSRYLNRPIDIVKVTTPLVHVTEGEVRRLLAAYMHEGFFDIDVRGVKQGLEAHPWIAQAEVKRVWPNSLALKLTEEIAIARWGDEALLNQYGRRFKPARLDAASSLPLLSGPGGTETRIMEQFQAFNQILAGTGLRIEQLNMSDRGSWELQTSSGLQLVVGRVDVRSRLKRFAVIYARRLVNDIADIQQIDLRYSNGFTVRKKHPDHSKVAAR